MFFSEIVVRAQKPKFVKMFEQLNDHLLVGSEISLTPHYKDLDLNFSSKVMVCKIYPKVALPRAGLL